MECSIVNDIVQMDGFLDSRTGLACSTDLLRSRYCKLSVSCLSGYNVSAGSRLGTAHGPRSPKFDKRMVYCIILI